MRKLYPLLLALLLFACAPTANVTTYSARSPLTYYASNPEVPLYEAPTSPTAKRTVSQNTKLVVVGRQKPSWLVVKHEDQTYYVLEDALSLSPSALTATSTAPTPATAPASRGGSSSPSHDVQTGPRGGKYYINSNGNKTYIKRK